MSDALRAEIGVTLTNGANSLQMNMTRETDRNLQSFGDARLVTEIQSSGFSGAGVCWVEGPELDAFIKSIAQLNEGERVSASLASISPGNFSLLIKPIGSRGHFLVEGQIGRLVSVDEYRFQHAVTFGFWVEWAQIAELAMSLDS